MRLRRGLELSLCTVQLLLGLHADLADSTRFLKYCSPPGPHTPYAKSLKRSNHVLREALKNNLDPLLRAISTKADRAATHNVIKKGTTKPVIDGGVHMSLAITSPTDTFYTFNYGPEFTKKNSNPTSIPWNHHTKFRIASVSKIFTVWEILHLGLGWDERVVQYLPELTKGAYANDWSELTIGALAGHIGGVMRDFEHDLSQKPLSDCQFTKRSFDNFYDAYSPPLLYCESCLVRDFTRGEDGFLRDIWDYYFQGFDPKIAYTLGFPPFEKVERNKCFWNCTREEVLNQLANYPLIYPGYTIPAYSNVGFVLLGLILERKTGLKFEELMKRDLYIPLNFKDTFHKLPSDWRQMPEGWGAFPYWGALRTWNETKEIWGEWGVPAGGIYSSAHDLSKFLRMIISAFPYCTELHCHEVKRNNVPATKIREWLSPTAFTGGRTILGRPWEIKRKKFAGIHGDRALTLYSKAGSGTGYNVGITVIPELGLGIAILLAGDNPDANSTTATPWDAASIAKTLYKNSTLLQIVEKTSYEDTEIDYRGNYIFERFLHEDTVIEQDTIRKTTSPIIDSNMRIVMDNGPGLRILSWESNGTDFIHTLVKIVIKMQRGKKVGAVPVARLFPVGWSTGAEKKWGETQNSGEFIEDWRVWLNWEWENIEHKNSLIERSIPGQSEESGMFEDTTAELKEWATSVQYQYPKVLEDLDDTRQRQKFSDELLNWLTRFIQGKERRQGQMIQRPFRSTNKKLSRPTSPREVLRDSDKRPEAFEGARAQYSRKLENSGRVAAKPKGNRTPLKGSRWKLDKEAKGFEDAHQRFTDKGSSHIKNAYYRLPKMTGGRHSGEVVPNVYSEDTRNVVEEVEEAEEEEAEEGRKFEAAEKAEKPDRVDDTEREDDETSPIGRRWLTEDTADNIKFWEGEQRGVLDQSLADSQYELCFNSAIRNRYDQDTLRRVNQQREMASPKGFDGEHWRFPTKQIRTNNNIWPCLDYNGIELHAWNGWSLGHVRLIRKNAGGRVIAMELPALGIRLRKITAMVSKMDERKMGKVRSYYYYDDDTDDVSWEYPIWNDEYGRDL